MTQFIKFVLQNLYFGTLNCKNKFHKHLFCNGFFLQGNPLGIFIYSIYIYIYVYIYIYIYILNYIYILYIIYIIYIFYIHIIYIYDKENTITTSGVDGFDAMDE